jgi:hypothetical protein
VAKRVFKRQHRAPRMPKQHHLVEMKMLSDLIDIGDFRFERNVFRLHVISRATAPTLVVINKMKFVGEAVQLRQKLGAVEVWAAVQYDYGRAPPDFAAIQHRALNWNAALVRRGVLALSSTTCAYNDDGKKQQGFHGEKLHQGHGGRNETIRKLASNIAGHVITPEASEYDAARSIFNRAFDWHPAAIVRCAGASDVVRTLEFAQTNHLPLAVRAGGHSRLGFGMCDGGVVIDLSAMKRVQRLYSRNCGSWASASRPCSRLCVAGRHG